MIQAQRQPEPSDTSIPIGTFLAKVQYAPNKGKLPSIIHDDPTQPFHFVAMKASPRLGEEPMFFHVSTYPYIQELAKSLHAHYTCFKEVFHNPPDVFEARGFRAAYKLNERWKSLLILMSPYKYPTSFLSEALRRISHGLSLFFERPSFAAAQFAQKSLVVFMKSMSTVRGISAVLATYKSPVQQEYPRLMETDTLLAEVGPKQIIEGVIDDPEIQNNVAVFVFGRILYTTMSNPDLFAAELLVGNLYDTTSEHLTTDNRLFCLAKHFHTVMVTISEPGRGLEKCCSMQVSLMKLDAQGVITKMQQSFAKKLPPAKALDILVVSGPFVVTQPPFIEAPLFAANNLGLQSNAIAAQMYEKMMSPGFNCIVDYIIEKYPFRVKLVRHGDDYTFLHTNGPVDEKEAAPLPQLLKAVRA